MSVEWDGYLLFFLNKRGPHIDYLYNRILNYNHYQKIYISYSATSRQDFNEQTNIRYAIKHNGWFKNS